MISMDKKKKTELLAPAGSFDSARAAVNAGADAIYMGGPLFSARAYAESSKKDMLIETLDFCHLRGVKVFMTLNTLVKEDELKLLRDYLNPYYEHGLDAVIVQDIGVLKFMRDNYPDIDLHMSTQAGVSGPLYTKLLMELGVKRIVTARELSLKEINGIFRETGAEIEVFAHGALCYSYSGYCLMSSFIGGRSGNRGRCAGTCRLPYEVLDDRKRQLNRNDIKYVLSMKDLNTAAELYKLIAAGAYSFKIEGRMKSPEYVAASTAVYRKYLDMAMEMDEADYDNTLKKDSDSDELRLLSEVFERGSTSGYLHGKNDSMLTLKEKPSLRKRDENLIKSLREQYIIKDKKAGVKGVIRLRKGCLPEFYLEHETTGISVTELGDMPVDIAKQRPVTSREAEERVSRLGDTDFEMLDIRSEIDEGIFVPVGELNTLKRRAAKSLKNSVLERYRA